MQAPSLQEIRFVVIAAALAVVMLTGAISYGIVHKVNNGDDIVAIAKSNSDQADRQSNEIAALRRQLDTQTSAFQHQLALNGRQAHHVAAVQRYQNAILIRALRRAGIPVPPAALVSGGGHPKGPSTHRPSSRGTPAPTGPSPSVSPTCLLVPTLCVPPVSVPTLLPKE